MSTVPPSTLSELAALAPRLAGSEAQSRVLLGVVGPPGAGKSTLAAALVEALNVRDDGGWDLLGMDGFHLSNRVLIHLGQREHKGAPHTFDVGGFVNALSRIKTRGSTPVYLPVFHREIEEPIAAESVLEPEVRGVVVEGNYLLHDNHGWHQVRALLDECWYLDVDSGVRTERLVARASATYGSLEAGQHWVQTVDEPNAALIALGMPRADRVVAVGHIA